MWSGLCLATVFTRNGRSPHFAASSTPAYYRRERQWGAKVHHLGSTCALMTVPYLQLSISAAFPTEGQDRARAFKVMPSSKGWLV